MSSLCDLRPSIRVNFSCLGCGKALVIMSAGISEEWR